MLINHNSEPQNYYEKRKLKRENQYIPDEADTLFERARLRRKNVLRSLKSFPLPSIVVFPWGITRPKLSNFNVYNRLMAVFIFPDVVPCKNQKGEGELGKNE